MVAQIWVDADACPNVIKEILFRAADRQRRMVTLVANHPLKRPPSPWIQFVQVPKGFDVADNSSQRHLELERYCFDHCPFGFINAEAQFIVVATS